MSDDEDTSSESSDDECQTNIDEVSELHLDSYFKSDLSIYTLGVLSGGLFGNTISAGALVMGTNVLCDKYIQNMKVSNCITLSLYMIFFMGVWLNCFSYQVIAACEIGFNMNRSVCNMNIDTKRAALLSISVNLLFDYSQFGITVIFLNCIYRSIELYDIENTIAVINQKMFRSV